MNNDTISELLVIVLGIMIFILMILSIIFLVLKAKENKREKEFDKKIKGKSNKKSEEKTARVSASYNRQSVMDFMDFEKIEDNMIIQKKGKRFLMIVECQGVNYDLMSRIEKVGVEEGFQQFLNTLRHPVQIYIQTRTINLEKSISNYNKKVKEVEDKYKSMMYEYQRMKNSDIYSKEDLDRYFFELTKQKNLLEYGKDIVANTEKMSLNRNVLSKRYYIVVPYFSEEAGDEKYDFEEIKNIAFSELYTKSQSIIRTLSSCSINGKILSSKELVELLYVAYNRDESETFGINKAVKAGYDELYSTAPDIFEKKVKALDDLIRERAIDLANEKIDKVRSKTQQIVEDKELNLEELVEKMAKIIIKENEQYVGKEIAEKAIEEIEEGGDANEEIKTKGTRGRKKKATI